MDGKLVIVGFLLLLFFWLITLPGRKRRREDSDDRRRRKTHNSRMVRYSGFDTSVTEEGHRVVHAKQRNGASDCSDQCPFCAKGIEYQGTQLRVFDDRLIRGRRDRKRMRRGE